MSNESHFWVTVTLLSILFMMLLIFLGFHTMNRKLRGYYESGANAVMIHHKYRGTYGSRAYRDAAFEWGDPQDEEDLKKIEAIMKGDCQ